MAKSKSYSVILGTKYDAEIIGKLESVKNKSAYIKDLIMRDMSGELSCVENFTDDTESAARQYSSIAEEKYKEQFDINGEKTVVFQCSYARCSELIGRLDSMENKSEYVKRLILMDMGLVNQSGSRFMLMEADGEKPPAKNRKSSDKKLETQKEYGKRTGYAANKKWNKENLKRIPLDVNLELYKSINEHIFKTNESRNGFIKRAIKETIDRDCNANGKQ